MTNSSLGQKQVFYKIELLLFDKIIIITHKKKIIQMNTCALIIVEYTVCNQNRTHTQCLYSDDNNVFSSS